MLGTAVLMNHIPEPPDFIAGEGDGSGFVQQEVPVNVPPPPPVNQTVQMDQVSSPSSASSAMTVLSVDNPSATQFTMPTMVMAPAPVMPTEATRATQTIKVKPSGPQELSIDQKKRIARFTGGWAKNKGGSRWNGTGAIKDREFEFTAYLAKYAGGDWASTNNIDKSGHVWRGSLPNLINFMNKFSNNHIKASSQVVPLDLSKWENEIAVKKPPFIFFTGHRDFILTDKEVASLQQYVQSGGCIWGDSSLPGLRSRFDLAFRREMRRVIPDVDKHWEVLPPTYAIYTKNPYYKEIKQPPAGVNSYQEPIYALKYGGEVAIIYTPNDYGDMWRLALDKDLKIDKTRIEHSWTMKYTDDSVFNKMDVYYRGMELPHIIDSYKFGTNVVIHLLTRWEDRIKNIPTGL